MKNKLVLLVLLLSSCGMPPQVIDLQVNKMFEEFNKAAIARGKHVTANETTYEFREKHANNENAIASCFKSRNHVIFYTKWWDKMTSTSKEHTIFHELGHCVLKLDHRTDHYSIMYPTHNINNESEYVARKQELLDELFQDAQ